MYTQSIMKVLHHTTSPECVYTFPCRLLRLPPELHKYSKLQYFAIVLGSLRSSKSRSLSLTLKIIFEQIFLISFHWPIPSELSKRIVWELQKSQWCRLSLCGWGGWNPLSLSLARGWCASWVTSLSTIVMSMRKEAISLGRMVVLAPCSAHARPSAQPPIDASGNFLVHMCEGGRGENLLKLFLINFLAESGNFKQFWLKRGGGDFLKLFLINFLAKSGNSKQFFLHFTPQNRKLWSLCLPCTFKNSGHYVYLPSP